MSRTSIASCVAVATALTVSVAFAAPALAVSGNVPIAKTARITTGAPIGAMVRNGTTTKQTEIIGSFANTKATGGYVTRQSNTATGPTAGGGAIYGCRGAPGGTVAGSAPCLRGSNVANGYAFEFAFNGPLGGAFLVGKPSVNNPNAAPFTTNATGVATGLNADNVDSLSAAQIAATPGPPSGAAGGALAGTYPNPTIAADTRGVATASVVVSSTGVVQSYFNRTGGAPSVVHTDGTGSYSVTFPGSAFDVGSNAAPTATLTGSTFGFVNATTSGGAVVVSTGNTASPPVGTDAGFSLVVFGTSPTG